MNGESAPSPPGDLSRAACRGAAPLTFRQTVVANLPIVGLLGGAAAMLLWHLGRPCLSFDESASWLNVAGSWSRWWDLAANGEDCGGFLYSALLKGWAALFGTSEAALRGPTVLFSLLLILAVYRIGAALVDRRFGLVSAALIAFHPQGLYFARQARGYSLFMLLAAGGLLGLVLQKTGRTRRGRVLLGLSALGLAATHVFGVFAVAGLALGQLALAWRASPGRPWRSRGLAVLPLVPAGVLAMVWAWVMRARVDENLQNFWIPGRFSLNCARAFLLMGLPLLIGAAFVLVDKQSVRLRPLAKGAVLMAVPVFFGPVAVSLLVRGGHNFILTRYFVPLLPVTALLLAVPALRLTLGRAGVAAAGVMLAGVAVWAALWQPYAEVAKEGWDIRAAARFLAASFRPGDRLQVVPRFMGVTLEYYRQKLAAEERPPLGSFRTGRESPAGQTAVPCTWTLVFGDGSPGRPAASPASPAENVYRFGTLRVYRRVGVP